VRGEGLAAAGTPGAALRGHQRRRRGRGGLRPHGRPDRLAGAAAERGTWTTLESRKGGLTGKRETMLLEALARLLRVSDETVRRVEENCPGLAEVGYWSRDEKDAYDRAKQIVAEASARRELPNGF